MALWGKYGALNMTSYRLTWFRAALLAALLPLAGLAALPRWADCLWRAAWPEDAVRREAARERELHRKSRACLVRLARKAEVARALASGRMTLPEAAARLGALNRLPPEVPWRLFRDGYPGASDEERFCREALYWAEGELCEGDPCEAAATLGRLEAELDGLLRRGTLRLPAVAEAPLPDGD
jgi:hypothetical protein